MDTKQVQSLQNGVFNVEYIALAYCWRWDILDWFIHLLISYQFNYFVVFSLVKTTAVNKKTLQHILNKQANKQTIIKDTNNYVNSANSTSESGMLLSPIVMTDCKIGLWRQILQRKHSIHQLRFNYRKIHFNWIFTTLQSALSRCTQPLHLFNLLSEDCPMKIDQNSCFTGSIKIWHYWIYDLKHKSSKLYDDKSIAINIILLDKGVSQC